MTCVYSCHTGYSLLSSGAKWQENGTKCQSFFVNYEYYYTTINLVISCEPRILLTTTSRFGLLKITAFNDTIYSIKSTI